MIVFRNIFQSAFKKIILFSTYATTQPSVESVQWSNASSVEWSDGQVLHW